MTLRRLTARQVMPVLHPPPSWRVGHSGGGRRIGCAQYDCRREHHAAPAGCDDRHRRNSEQGAMRRRASQAGQTRSNRSCSGRTSRRRAAPVGRNAATATAPPSAAAPALRARAPRRQHRGQRRRFGRVPAAAAAGPGFGSRLPRNPWLRARTGPPGATVAAAAVANLDATAKEAVFGAPYVRRRRRGVPPRCRRRGERGGTATTTRTRSSSPARGRGEMRGSNEPAVAVVGGGARPHSPLPHAAAVEATLAAGDHTAAVVPATRCPKPETRRVAPDASGMPSDRRRRWRARQTARCPPTRPAGVPAPYTPTRRSTPRPPPRRPPSDALWRAPHLRRARRRPPRPPTGERRREDAIRPRSRPPASLASSSAMAAAPPIKACASILFGKARRPGVSEAAAAPVAPVESGRLQIQAAAAEARVPSTPGPSTWWRRRRGCPAVPRRGRRARRARTLRGVAAVDCAAGGGDRAIRFIRQRAPRGAAAAVELKPRPARRWSSSDRGERELARRRREVGAQGGARRRRPARLCLGARRETDAVPVPRISRLICLTVRELSTSAKDRP